MRYPIYTMCSELDYRTIALRSELSDELISELEQKVDNARLWFWLSQNPSLFDTDVSSYMPKVAYNRIGHNPRLPMDVEFLSKWKHKISMLDVLNHSNATPEVKEFARANGAWYAQ